MAAFLVKQPARTAKAQQVILRPVQHIIAKIIGIPLENAKVPTTAYALSCG